MPQTPDDDAGAESARGKGLAWCAQLCPRDAYLNRYGCHMARALSASLTFFRAVVNGLVRTGGFLGRLNSTEEQSVFAQYCELSIPDLIT